MSRSRMQISIINRPKENFDTNLVRIDSEKTKAVGMTCRESFHQYLRNSTLHGLRYIGDRSLSFFERFDFCIRYLILCLY